MGDRRESEEVPAPLARLWRLSGQSRLGRPAALDVDRVVRTAVELADRDGLSGVTLPKVAQELGVTAMSLYRYVGSKDELFILMADLASGPAPQLPTGGAQWRTGLRAWALAIRETHLRHPWLSQLPMSAPPNGPHAIGWMDAGLRTLRDTGLDWGAKLGVIMLVSGYVRSSSQLALELAAGRHGTGLTQTQVERDYGRAMARLVDPDRFPDAAQLFASGVFEPAPGVAADEPASDDFTFGLELILDGVAAAIATANRQPR